MLLRIYYLVTYQKGWAEKNKSFNNAVKYLEKQGYDGFIDPQDGAQQEKHGQAPMATVIFNPKKNIEIVSGLDTDDFLFDF